MRKGHSLSTLYYYNSVFFKAMNKNKILCNYFVIKNEIIIERVSGVYSLDFAILNPLIMDESFNLLCFNYFY